MHHVKMEVATIFILLVSISNISPDFVPDVNEDKKYTEVNIYSLFGSRLKRDEDGSKHAPRM